MPGFSQSSLLNAYANTVEPVLTVNCKGTLHKAASTENPNGIFHALHTH